jgi:trigger factor
MNVKKNDLGKGEIELIVEVEWKELSSFINRAAESISKEIKLEGFRPGKVPLEILKQKGYEMDILEEAARMLIGKQAYEAIKENIDEEKAIGQPEIGINKLAPDNPLEYKIKILVLPDVEIGNYKDLGLKKEEVNIKEEELNKALKDLADMRAQEKVSIEPIKDEDKVIASVNLFLGDVPVEDGQNPEVTILMGKDYFVEGFDKNLMGLKKGDEKDFNIKYPSNHWNKNLAGKLVSFKVKVKEIYKREKPEINDELAKTFRFNNLGQLKENLKKSIEEQKKKEIDQKTEGELLNKIIEGSKFGEIADGLIENESGMMIKELEQSVVSQGAKFEDYLKSIGKNEDQLKLDMMPNAVKRVKSALILKEIAKKEKIEISSEEINKEIEALKKQYGDNPDAVKNISTESYKAYLANFLLNQKILSSLKEWNIK